VNKKELISKLKALGEIDEQQKKSAVCALIGHSRIMTECFGYWSCGRCGQQIGDSLGGVFDGRDKVIIGHDCRVCRKNFKTIGWEDKFMTPYPFANKV
jgi:ribosomal protein L37AE/L43A